MAQSRSVDDSWVVFFLPLCCTVLNGGISRFMEKGGE